MATRYKTASSPASNEQTVGLQRYTLTVQFMIAGSVVLLVGMLAIGFWVTNEIEDGVTRNTASATALYMDSFVAPRVQELKRLNRVSPDTQRTLDNIFKDNELGRRIVSVKIWKQGGLIVYSSNPAIMGKSFPITDELTRSLAGEVTAEFGDLHDEEDAAERAKGKPLLEIYSPIRETRTGRVIAVAEFYETAEELEDNLFRAKVESWFVVACVTVLMLLSLSGIVVRGSHTIERQRDRLQRSSNRVAEINERYLHRIGADLHDGPAQLISYALLRVDSLKSTFRKLGSTEKEPEEIKAIHDALHEAMGEIRELSAGLTLAKLEEKSPREVVEEIVRAHERRTETQVTLIVESTPGDLPLPLKISIFRFIQEALNNAYRHGQGIDQQVHCRFAGRQFELNVSDGGPGFIPGTTTCTEKDGGLGLIGLRERIENLGGTLKVDSTPGEGTRLTMQFRVGQKNKPIAG